ncbi:MAG: hypothetical protein M0P58_11620 [Bacteroidales bacterium]|nr:hypothetical protein [Bacteroidales bacterium]
MKTPNYTMLTFFDKKPSDTLAIDKADIHKKLIDDHFVRLKPGFGQSGIRNIYYHEPDNTLLVSHCRNNRVHLFNFSTGTLRLNDLHSKTVRKILVYKNEIITASRDETVRVVCYHTLKQRMVLSAFNMGRCPYVAVSDKEGFIISISYDSDIKPKCKSNSVKIWSLKQGTLEGVINNTGEHLSSLRSGACMTYDKYLYVISDSGYLSLYLLGSFRLIKTILLSHDLRAMCIHPSRNLILVGDIEGTVFICSLLPTVVMFSVKCHKTDISTIRIHPDREDIVITTSFDGAIRFWKFPSFNCEAVINCDSGKIWTQTMRKDILFAGADDGNIWFYNINDLNNCILNGKLILNEDSFVVCPIDSNSFFTNDISNFDLLQKDTGEPVTGKYAEYQVNLCNRESLLHQVFWTQDDVQEFLYPSIQMKPQLLPPVL